MAAQPCRWVGRAWDVFRGCCAFRLCHERCCVLPDVRPGGNRRGQVRLQGTGPVGRLRISCIDGHSWLLLADRVKEISPWDNLDQIISQPEHRVTMAPSQQIPLPVDHRQADQAE